MNRVMTAGEHNDIPIAVERTGRKRTASFQVNNGRVRVLVPRHLTDRDVSALIARKMAWIEQTVKVQAGLLQGKRI